MRPIDIMRPVYDRVPSDTRRALIPDLPYDGADRREWEKDGSGAILAIAAIFGFMMLVAISLGVYSSHIVGASAGSGVEIARGAE